MPFFDVFASPRWSPLRMRTKVVSFFVFFQELSNKKKIKALRPKMAKIASRGSCLNSEERIFSSLFQEDHGNARYEESGSVALYFDLDCRENPLAGRSLQLPVKAELEESERNECTEVLSLAWIDFDFQRSPKKTTTGTVHWLYKQTQEISLCNANLLEGERKGLLNQWGPALKALTLRETTARNTNLRKMQSYKSAFYQKKEALLLNTTLPCLKVFFSLITKNKSKNSSHTEKFAKSRLKEKSSGRMRTKRQNRTACCFLRCISSSPGHWQHSKLPQQGRVLSDRKRGLQTTFCLDRSWSRALANRSLPAQQTRHQDKNCIQLHCRAWRQREAQLQRAKTTTFSTERRSFQSVNRIACHSAVCTRKMAMLR